MIVVIAFFVWAIYVYSEQLLMLIASGYLITGLALHMVRLVRHRLVSRPA
jgi:hypothetical protein